MKKFIFTIAAFVLGISQMSAQKLVFGDVDLPLGGQATLTVKYETGGESLTSASFTLALPDGVTSEKKSDGGARFVLNDDMVESFAAYTTAADGYSVAATSLGVQFPGTSGVLGTVTLFAAADAANLEIGKSYPVTVSGLSLVKRTSTGLVSIPFDDITFNVKITDRWILNETSTVAPAATDGAVNVLVKRTINKNQWSTICLPFDLTSEQFYGAFGSDAKLAYFDEDAVEVSPKLGAGEADEIKINFTSDDLSEGFVGNYPYIIKCSKDITEFTFDDVVIAPDEVSSSYTKTISKKKYTYGFYGTYEAETVLAENTLFLANNLFYYSAGLTKMKAFRCYFNFADVLKDKGNSAKISLAVDGDATSIDGINVQYDVDGVYDLSGRKIQLENGDLNKLQKGVYIIDGKKVTIK